jgi:hypothetical protein
MKTDKLSHELLQTLSFFDEMGLDQIFLELNPIFIKDNHELTYADLLNSLERLEKDKMIRSKTVEKHKTWVKVYPNKNKLKRFLTKIFS